MTPIKDKIILGIDPGTTIMGYGLLHIADNKPQMLAMGVLELKKYSTHYLKLQKIYERVISIIDSYLPDELAIEAPFYGKNVQSIICAAQDKDVDHRQRAGQQGTGGRHAEKDAAHKRRDDAAATRCHRRTGCGILPLSAIDQTGNT